MNEAKESIEMSRDRQIETIREQIEKVWDFVILLEFCNNAFIFQKKK